MKKIFYILASAIVALGAVACENDVMDNIATENEGLSFVATIDNSKTDLDGLKTIWSENDVITINNFDFAHQGEGKFTCTDSEVSTLKGQSNLTAWYNEKGIDSEAGTAGAQLKAEGAFDAEGNASGFSFAVQNAFLKFTTTETVTLNGTGLFVVNKEVSNEVTIEGTGETQYVAINPANTTLSYSVNGVKCKEVTLPFEAKKVYNLGELGLTASGYNLVGSFQGWDVAAGKAVVMYTTTDGWAVAKGIELYKSDEFKIIKGNAWTTSYGLASVGVLAVDKEVKLQTSNSQNMKAAKNGKFDIYFNGTNIKYECVEEYTDLTVNIKINNEANWSPLYITLKSGENVVVDNATVTGNVFAVSGDYIGESLSYTLSNGTKTSEGNVSITKDGASINLVEQVIKFVFQLDTDNAKKWWGTTAKIHIWKADASIATSWPGVLMTYDGNYTWHYDIPASLAGTKMTYLIHNGGGWQSSEPTITLSAQGHTIKGSSINVK